MINSTLIALVYSDDKCTVEAGSSLGSGIGQDHCAHVDNEIARLNAQEIINDKGAVVNER